MTDRTAVMLEEFSGGHPESARLLDAVLAVMRFIGPYDARIGKSQVAFRRRVAFAWVWMPRAVLRGRGAPLVLSVRLRRRDTTVQWNQVVEPYPGRFMHHLELWTASDLNEALRNVLREAWDCAK